MSSSIQCPNSFNLLSTRTSSFKIIMYNCIVAISLNQQGITLWTVSIARSSNIAHINILETHFLTNIERSLKCWFWSSVFISHFIIRMEGRNMPRNTGRDSAQESSDLCQFVITIVTIRNNQSCNLYPKAHLIGCFDRLLYALKTSKTCVSIEFGWKRLEIDVESANIGLYVLQMLLCHISIGDIDRRKTMLHT